MYGRAFYLSLVLILSSAGLEAMDAAGWTATNGRFKYNDENISVEISPAFNLSQERFTAEFNARVQELVDREFDKVTNMSPVVSKGSVLSRTIEGETPGGERVIRILAFFATGNAVFTKTTVTDLGQLELHQQSFQALIQVELPKRLKNPQPLPSRAIVADNTINGNKPSPSPDVQQGPYTGTQSLPKYKLPGNYQGVFCVSDSSYSFGGYQVENFPVFLLRDGTAIRNPLVAPERLDLKRSKKNESELWGRWERVDDGYEMTFNSEDGPYSVLVSDDSEMIPFRIGERMNRNIISMVASGMPGITSASVSTDRMRFDFNGNFSEGHDSTYTSGALTAGPGGADVVAVNSRGPDGNSTTVSATGNGVGVHLSKDQPGGDYTGKYRLSGYSLQLEYDSGKKETLLAGMCDQNREYVWVGKSLYWYEASYIEDAVPYEWKIHLDYDEKPYFVPEDLAGSEIYRFSISERHPLNGRTLESWLINEANSDVEFQGAKSVSDGKYSDNGRFGVYYRAFIDNTGRQLQAIYSGLKANSKDEAAYLKIVVSDPSLVKRYLSGYTGMSKKLISVMR